MGHRLFDQYSLLHFAIGVIAYFWGISIHVVIILHVLFEYSENTTSGMRIINTHFKDIWPGGKPRADTIVNRLGDTLSTIVGWYVAYYANKYAIKYRWYVEYGDVFS